MARAGYVLVPSRRVIQAFRFRAVLQGMLATGLPMSALLERAGVDESEFDHSVRPIPNSTIEAVWRAAFALAPRDTLAIEVGLATPFGAFGPFDFLIRTARNAVEALDAIAEFQPFAPVERTIVRGTVVRARLPIVFDRDARRVGVPLLMTPATLLARFRATTPAPQRFRLELALDRPRDPERFEAIVGAPIDFGKPYPAFVVEGPSCEAPFATHDPELHASLRMLARAGELGASVHSVASAVCRELADGRGPCPSPGDIATRLGMSTRTLHRRLKQESTSFAGIREDLRKTRALLMLANSDKPIAEIALDLGFSDQTTFHRAFKRWTGRTPKQFRDGSA